MEISIIAETPDYVVISKPAGLIVHPDGKRTEESLVDWILENYPEIADVGEPFETHYRGELVAVGRPGIVHRLDRDTSGVMVVARTQQMYEHLKQQFKDRQIAKEYRAIVLGIPPETTYTVTIPIGRDMGSIEKWRATRDPKRVRGELRDALTYMEVLATGQIMAREKMSFSTLQNSHYTHEGLDSDKLSDSKRHFFSRESASSATISYIRAVPKTGRTHQIRVHAQYLGYPVLGDRLYGGRTMVEMATITGVTRGLLHAYILKFTDLDGAQMTFHSPIPADMVDIVAQAGITNIT